MITNSPPPPEPAHDCPLCPRLLAYRSENRAAHPDWFNGPAPSFGDPAARLLIVGLAPGRQGANRTGRPFTGDYAGVLLYQTLLTNGFAQGRYEARADDGLRLVDCMITNAVRCAPPLNRPLPTEENTCRPFLAARIAALPRLKVIVTLGGVARRNVMRALGMAVGAEAAGHGAECAAAGLLLIHSYHCSRLNTNTGRLTAAMFEAVFERARAVLENRRPNGERGAHAVGVR
ncbi:MAG: uracil-DNA glycosylase [Caulobacteraceae bacterium]